MYRKEEFEPDFPKTLKPSLKPSGEEAYNLGNEERGDNWVETEEIPDSQNFQHINSPAEELMEKEKNEILFQIDTLRKDLISLNEDHPRRKMILDKIKELENEIGITRVDYISEEILRIKDELNTRDLDGIIKKAKQKRIEMLEKELKEIMMVTKRNGTKIEDNK